MKRDFKSCMLYALFGLPIFLLLFIAIIYFANCGFSARLFASQPAGDHPYPHPNPDPGSHPNPGSDVIRLKLTTQCAVTARRLADCLGECRVPGNTAFHFQGYQWKYLPGDICGCDTTVYPA